VHRGRLAPTPELFERLHREATRLEVLAQNLLALSSAEAGEASLERVDLETVAADAYDRYLPLALERGITLALDASPAVAAGDVRLLDQALNNLMSNALRATTTGGIQIRTGEGERTVGGESAVFLEVEDTGSGMRPGAEGRGLGLRVVRAVAAVHGGELTFAGGCGTRARVWLPALREEPPAP
jgi:two-component system, OmpR family, sensor kinase